MRTPAQYQHEVNEISNEEIKAEGVSESEARKALEKVNQSVGKLQEIENGLNLDLHALRAQYQGRAAALTMQTGRHAGHNQLEEQQRLEDERQGKLAPYEEVKAQIDQLRQKLEDVRGKLEKAVPSSK